MSRKNTWQAPAAAIEAMPAVSGNTVNGLGEKEKRLASPFFWHEQQYHDFGEMQKYTLNIMYGLEDGPEICEAFRINPNFDPALGDVAQNRQFIHRGPDPNEVCEQKVEKPAEEWSREIKEFALAHHADVVGIAKMSRDWVYEGFSINDYEQNIIVIGVAHDYEEIKEAPSLPGNNRGIVEVGKQYTRAATAAAELNNFIREQGYNTSCYPGPTAQAIMMIPAAVEAGLGELGKHGSMINRELGASFRLSAVTTDMPLLIDEPDVFGADDFCTNCQVCRNACPPDAIFDDKQWVRGEQKWYVDFDKCIPYFAEARGCAICIAVCPWSRPGIADNLVVKMARRREKKETES